MTLINLCLDFLWKKNREKIIKNEIEDITVYSVDIEG